YSVVFCGSFFFSSRRRHTRSKRDWSSDMCSSDLLIFALPVTIIAYLVMASFSKVLRMERAEREGRIRKRPTAAALGGRAPEKTRSEERRVGREGRRRRTAVH